MSDKPAYKNKRAQRAEESEGWEAEDDKARRQEAAAIRLGKTKAAMQMFIDGVNYTQIAAELGYGTAEAAAHDVHEALERHFLENSQISNEVLRMVELERLNTMYNALLPGISRGNSRAVDVGVKISDRISKMVGLDAPVKTEVVEIRMIEAEIARTRREIAERLSIRGELESGVIDVEVED